ncbi:MAG TPA: hypothetical protein VNH22_15130 [Blastocatellia bacterium]|jgi:hypothetical protein|nr:hypothetical protein [Blastocatellia bacterium]
MLLNQAKKGSRRRAGGQATQASGPGAGGRKLYSVAAWLSGRAFAGGFDLAGSAYELTFAPARAASAGNELQLRGRLTVTGPRGRARTRDDLLITLDSIQGGIGAPPARRQAIATGAQTGGNTATSQQKQQVAGENEKRAGDKEEEKTQARSSGLPSTESTGPTSFTGVMYFHFEPLDGRALGVPADLGRVQLNLRLAPLDATARALHTLYTAAVDALQGEQPDGNQAAAIIGEINRLLES